MTEICKGESHWREWNMQIEWLYRTIFLVFLYIYICWEGGGWVNGREWITIILLLMPLEGMLLLFYRMRKLNFRININHINIYTSEPSKQESNNNNIYRIYFCSKGKSWSPLRGDFGSVSICVLYFKGPKTHSVGKQASSMTSCLATIPIANLANIHYKMRDQPGEMNYQNYKKIKQNQPAKPSKPVE